MGVLIKNYHEIITVRDYCKDLVLTNEQIAELMEILLSEIKKGLRRDTHKSSTVKCFPTYVQDFPNGKEQGRFLSLDLGGTNFRVLLVDIKSSSEYDLKSKIYAIPQNIMLGSGEQLFDHIAECLANFMKENKVIRELLPLGFTFSFPLTQLGLTTGILERWTKGFNCSGVIGQDVVQLLKDAIDRRGDVQIDVMAILNDSTGTLMSCAHKSRDCRIGVIVGTGSNTCYAEKVENCELFFGDRSRPYVLINTEWGAFGDNGCIDFIRTEYDKEIDESSINVGKQLHEKMISGMYMGEIARLILVKLTKMNLLFGGKGSDLLFTRGQFFTKYVSEIESDEPGTYTNCEQILDEIGLSHATEQDYVNVRYVCECVSRRAAHLVSAGIATLINKMNISPITVGIDGSVYRFHPHFHNLMMEKIKELVKPNIKFQLMLSEDGSGRGAALVAAVACREYKNTKMSKNLINSSPSIVETTKM